MALSKYPLSKFVGARGLRPTMKIFHKQYLVKVVLNIPGHWLLQDTITREHSEADVAAIIKSRGKGGYQWGVNLDDALATQLVFISKTLDKKNVRVRHAFGFLTVYFQTEKDAYEVLNSSHWFGSYVEEIYCPSSEEAAKKLQDKVVFTKTVPFKYKVFIRENRYSLDQRKKIITYFDSLEPGQAQIPKGILRKLRAKTVGTRYWEDRISGHFYILDDSTLLFLKMIEPAFVLNYYALEILPTK